VQKQFAKNKWDFPQGPPGYDYSMKGKAEPPQQPQGFISAGY